MRYGIAVWNFVEPGVSLTDLIDEFAGVGFDAFSFSTGQFSRVEATEWQEIGRRLRDRGLAATMHGNFDVSYGDLQAVLSALGEAVRAVTFDPCMQTDSRGSFYDWQRMGEMLEQVDEASGSVGFRFGVEDFPLDAAALAFYEESVPEAVRQSPRWGTLVDLGHLNLRLHDAPYFQSLTPQAYIERVPLPIIEVHVHDNAGDRDSHAPIGEGTTPFGDVARALRRVGFDGVSTIEIAPGFHGRSPADDKPRARDSLATWRRLLEGPPPA